MVGYSWTDPAVLTFIAMPVGLVVALLWLVHLASRRLDEPAENRRGALIGTAAIAVAWMTATWIAASSGVLRQWDPTPPPFAFLVAGIAILIGSLAPGSWRPLAGAAALGAQYALLWALGHGPVIGPDGGVIVPMSAMFLLALTALLTVLTPLAALFSRRFFQTVEEEAGGPRPPRAPGRGARWDDG